MERLHDKCGVVGIYARSINAGPDAERDLILSLAALQHRGLESAGIAISDEKSALFRQSGMGKVRDVFSNGYPDTFPAMQCGIGHVRYSTAGASCSENAGPFVVGATDDPLAALALAHNGNIINIDELRSLYPQDFFDSTTDSEIIAFLLLFASGPSIRERLIHTIPRLRGAYALTILADGKLYAFRDPWGLRPLCLGYTQNSWIVASESCALDRVGAQFIRQVEPGELITIDDRGMHSEILVPTALPRLCVFEPIYFAAATSRVNETDAYSVRQALGRELAREHQRRADYVVPIPETAIPAAIGYAAATGIPYEPIIIKNSGSDRTFISPSQHERQDALRQKFSFVASKIAGARLILVDDSIVRGNTMKHLVTSLRHFGAKEIHLLSSSPPLRHPCQFGIDIPQASELIATNQTLDAIATELGVDSLGYLSLDGLSKALSFAKGTFHKDDQKSNFLDDHYCFSCMAQRGWPFRPQSTRNKQIHIEPLPTSRM